MNLGGPDSLQAVKPFLYNLFSDREIIKLGPSFMQKPLAWLISTVRSHKTRKMYSLIGGKSPILDITKAQAELLEKALNGLRFTVHGSRLFRVYTGMRYWHPFIKDTVDEILKDGIRHIIVLTLYPHYSRATTGSAIAEFKKAIERFTVHGSRFTVKYIEQWYDFPPYIEAITELINKGLSGFNETDEIPRPDRFGTRNDNSGRLHGKEDITLLYSAHNIPKTFIKKGDPYLEHIKSTITAVNKRLSLLLTPHSSLFRWHLSFQSKSGPVRWLKPTTEETMIRLANEGCKNLFVVPISFVSDHIETLYEIDIFYKKLAEKHGVNFKRCEALNTSEKFIEVLKELVMKAHTDDHR